MYSVKQESPKRSPKDAEVFVQKVSLLFFLLFSAEFGSSVPALID